jgi:opacity protein-like surface antigen
MKLSKKLLITALSLIGAASAAAAQSYRTYGGCGLKERGYYGTPYDGGPQYGSGGGDQYGYGPAYSYARQAPSCSDPPLTSRVRTRHGKTVHDR